MGAFAVGQAVRSVQSTHPDDPPVGAVGFVVGGHVKGWQYVRFFDWPTIRPMEDSELEALDEVQGG